MLKLEDLKPGLPLEGLEPSVVATVAAVVPVGDGAVQVFYRTPEGETKERLLGRGDELGLSVATVARPWSFDGDGSLFQLTCEAKRIDLAFLFDPMMAVHTSNVDPLPHQITAVYESMLPRQPLRFVLADDPGAGKTIMAGLYIRELIMRADARRILIVAPGSLVEQWRDELSEKFGLDFHVYSSALETASPSGNPFEDFHQLVVRLDQMSRNEELQEKLVSAGWDLVVFDEAHKLAAHYFGSKLEKTGRFRFAERAGATTRHLLLMTATPHNGKEEDFQLFLSLRDSDRFFGKFRDGVHKVDTGDLMRRMVKEELVKFDGSPLFPERKAYTVNYSLCEIEAALYESVTDYVKTEMGKADELYSSRKGSVGFALTALQRRLASSPEAIFQSLKRRRERLESRLREEKLGARGRQAIAEVLEMGSGTDCAQHPQGRSGNRYLTPFPDVPGDDDDLNAEEQETLEETLVDDATAAKSLAELEAEIVILQGLELKAKTVVASGQDRKWDELSKILQNSPEMRDASGRHRKLIIFSEHRATLNYLQAKIAGVLGSDDAIRTIHGGTPRDERRKIQAMFRSDPEVRVLIATDAAGEGVNLQNANLMVNYDLPWNPNRLEQRFGRIQRIGQAEVCHVWNLVAKETREGDVYHRLLEKLEVESQALKGRVFDILGEVFEETSLKDLLIQAIRYGDMPEVRARLNQKIDQALDHDHLKSLLDRAALAQETMSADRLFAVKEEMDKAEARRLQPHYVRSFFLKAFEHLGGSIYPREQGRYEITHVPASIRERDRRITGRNRREQEPVLKRYERVCFEKDMAILPRLRDIARTALAWHSIVDDVKEGRLNIDLLQKKQAEKDLQAAEDAVPRTARECFRWLLCPFQNTPTDSKPAVEAFPLNTGGGTVASEIHRVCIDNELVITTWSPIHLRTKLKELYWKDGKTAAGAMTFWEDTLRYLYPPRLKSRDSLAQVIRTGAGSTDFFGTAYGQEGDKFEGFHIGEGAVQLDDTLLLIAPEAAKEYQAALKQAETPSPDAEARYVVSGGASNGDPSSGSGVRTVGLSGATTAGGQSGTGSTVAVKASAKSFHGSIDIPPPTAKMRLVQVTDEIISLLASDPNAEVTITLEINAQFPAGATDQLKRSITENANSLGFKSKVWE